MERYGYTLKKNSGEQKRNGRFRREELELMTTFQLREICRREKIIQGVLDPMDILNRINTYAKSLII